MTTPEVNGVSIVALEGCIVFGEESNALRAKVESLIADGKQKIVLNMKEIKYIDSAKYAVLKQLLSRVSPSEHVLINGHQRAREFQP